jgi:cation transport regulator
MPYSSTSELPESVKNVLPSHAQIIYKVAFNHAYSEYQNPEDRRGHEDRETVAHKVAWSAVKKKYEKADDGKWYAKK